MEHRDDFATFARRAYFEFSTQLSHTLSHSSYAHTQESDHVVRCLSDPRHTTPIVRDFKAGTLFVSGEPYLGQRCSGMSAHIRQAFLDNPEVSALVIGWQAPKVR
jgi:hypothetical protein